MAERRPVKVELINGEYVVRDFNDTDTLPTSVIPGGIVGGGIPVLTSDPSSPEEGEVWYNSTDNYLKFYNGTEVEVVSTEGIDIAWDGTEANLGSRTFLDATYIQETERSDFATAAQGDLADTALQTFTELNDVKDGDSAYVDGIKTDTDSNTDKVGITPTQTQAIVDNTAKVGITTEQAEAIVDNTAKVGITPTQTQAITDNTAKVTYPGKIIAGTDLTFAGNTLNYTGSGGGDHFDGSYNSLSDVPAFKAVATSGSFTDLIDVPAVIPQVTYWMDYVGGLPGDSIIVDSNTEVIPYNNGEYYREIQGETDKFYQTRIDGVLATLLATRGSAF